MRTSKAYLPLVCSALLLTAAPVAAEQSGQMNKEHKEMLQKMDENNDNTISREEFQAASMDEFAKADSDKNGQLSSQEQQKLVQMWTEHKDYSRARMGENGTKQQTSATGTDPARRPMQGVGQ
ncbi:MAG: EF-hand domain-containing protein [Bdellovibrionales bacterium]|nr:EF-hand domain-containing protein [Bdellovibrionales bacterium]